MNCSQCICALFDKIWGVYRCSKFKRAVDTNERASICEGYIRKKSETTNKESINE